MNRKVQGSQVHLRKILVGKKWGFLRKIAIWLSLLLSIWLVFITITLVSASSKPVDALFVLGGSIRREIYVAKLTKYYPQTQILISQGSADPCIWLIFQRELAPMNNVTLEKCADSTFDNFYYGIPILRRWNVHKVMLITSPTHLPRAKWLGQILFGAHGMWMETEIVQELGIPGNREFWVKTGLDMTRSLLWAGLSQIIQPQCLEVKRLEDVDMETWQRQGFRCERQGNLNLQSGNRIKND
ncbi:YdcF family protein [Chlorogloeopsis sp. ULAP01]|uniref:YdcF family protein n=1 Tax=Chlorogloeopsis sp. ULAP01 TaxID=3056483 RepID=UPI0025AACFB8|nr:YdcF family protein [Chlorogloeopsis sp. ULAP01]MDM9383332.1 YdcF family protein [Chlorogloeopsis sp. ULAP01]